MIDVFVGFLPSKMILICTVLAFFIPYSVYQINQKLHKDGDPAWKRQEKKHGKQQNDRPC